MIIAPLVALFLAFKVRKSLDPQSTVFGQLDKLLKSVMVAGAVLALIGPMANNHVLLLIPGYALAGWISWKIFSDKQYVGARSLMFSLLPLLLVYFFNDFVEKIFPDFFEKNDNYFGFLEFFGWIWFLSSFYNQNKQEKEIKREKELRAIEQKENRINAARKAELEVLVNLRTSEITRQNQKLQQTLDELSAAQEQLIHSEKMASLGELTAGIAHEIQNPLNFVNNFSELNAELSQELLEAIENGSLQEAQDLARDIMENQQKVVFHGKRADGIVKSMLQHSRNNSNVKEKLDINTIAEECIRLSYHGLRAKDKTFNAKMDIRLSESQPTVLGVSGDISRVLLNMCTNAFYAVMKKSRLQIAGYQPEVILTTGQDDDRVWINIEDNGEGIPEDNLDKIFQPFFTTKPTGEGTGLGLSMSYEIITKGHQGQIKVFSEVGVGTTFTIELPVNPE